MLLVYTIAVGRFAVMSLSSLPWWEITVSAATSALWVGVYFTKRWVEGKPERDAIDLRTKALDLHKAMKAENLTVDDLDKLTSQMSRRQRVREIEDDVASAVARQRFDEPNPTETQAAMNILSAADANVAMAMLERTGTEARVYCHDDGEALAALEKAQKTWEEFSTAEARYRASMYAGGTIYPTIVNSEIERLTVARIADLKAHIEWQKTL